MWNCRWLLCLVVIGLATRGASSMNEQPRSKNDSPVTKESDDSLSRNANSDGKRKSQNEPSEKDKDQVLHPSPAATATAEVATSSRNSNETVAFGPDTGAGTSMNVAKVGTHEQSRSKRHFRHSKLYHKEARSKSRGSSSKSNAPSGNLISISTDHLLVPSQILFHNPEHDSDSIKLIDSTAKTSAVTTSHDDSISTASSRLLFTRGSRDPSDRKFDKLSSRVTVSSGVTENWENSSSSSEAGSIIDEKSSSVELMEFTFDNVEGIRQSATPNEAMNRAENLTTSASIAMEHSSPATVATVQTSDRSIDESKSASGYKGIDRGQSIQSARSDLDDDIIYSVHTEKSRDAERLPNELSSSTRRDDVRNDDSVILVSIASESSASRNSRDTSSKGVGRSGNESKSTNLENDSNRSRSNVDDYSWVSVDDSLNRISLTEVVDTLKNVDLQESHGSYSYSNSTLSQVTENSSESKIQVTDAGAVLAKHPRSLAILNVPQSPGELRPTIDSDPEIELPDHSAALPISVLTKKLERPLKLIVPLNIETIVKARAKNNDLSSGKKTSDHLPFRLVLDSKPSSSGCFSDSETERLQNIQRIDNDNPFRQRRGGEITLSVSGNGIPEPEQCLDRRSSAQSLLRSIQEPDRPRTAFGLPVISSNSEEEEISDSLSASKSHETEAEARKSSESAIDEHRGAQSLASSGFIIFEDFEPVVHESLDSSEAVVPFETETATTAGHFFTAFADLEEQCNASSFDVFIPSVNSREIIARVEPGEETPLAQGPDPQNLTTTEDTLYIIEGFGFLKNSADEVSELEEEFDRRREASFDYTETETYPGYPHLDEHPPALKFVNQIELEAELPIKQEPLQRKRNIGDRNDDPWWLNDESKLSRGQAVRNDDTDERNVLIPSGLRVIPSLADNKVLPDMNESNNGSYSFFLLPTVYVLIGICIVLVGCSIWCSKIATKRQPDLPKLTYFVQERQGATQAV